MKRFGLLVGCAGLIFIGFIILGPGAAVLRLLLGGDREMEAIGGGWEVESISNRAGGDSMFQRRLLRKSSSVLVEPDARDYEYCGGDCVLYKTWSQNDGVHYRSACGGRRPALFVSPDDMSLKIKNCGLVFGDYVGREQVGKPVLSADEIKRKAMEQPRASLRRWLFRVEYVGNTRDTDASGQGR
jgi:hypothetical protein